MDLSPSQLSRKLAQSPGDTARFTLDELEHYVETTGDKEPIRCLAEKYFAGEETAELQRRVNELEKELSDAKTGG
eukprot:UN34092